ncbi:hypothetical protein [uncultured Flavobacterium sp.]|uniref:hypothetical protein n=1 Tax=uncultured Flavobacterium sp. TaxID=165435 RepID=UPI0030ECEE5C
MKTSYFKKVTLFFILSIISLLGLVISSFVMINHNGMSEILQGWVNLLWLPLPILTLIIDRYYITKFDAKKVNKFQCYIFGILILLFGINWIRLQLQV